MKTVALGNTGEQVSELCLGAMYFGSRVNADTSIRLLDQYIEAGGRFIDTANIYAHWIEGFAGGESETLLGGWMKERRNRQNLFIASKVGFGYGNVKTGLTSQLIIDECDKSLKRMGIETIDLYYAHVDDRSTPQEESLEAFSQLVKQGKVRYIGASNFRPWRLEEARWISQTRDLPDYCCVQQRYTYLKPRPETNFGRQIAANVDLMDYCRTRGITLLAYSPLLGGAYTRADRTLDRQYDSEDNAKRLAALRSVAAECNATPNQVILAWMLRSDPLVLPVFSASSPEQMTENLAALNLDLNTEQMERLDQAGIQ